MEVIHCARKTARVEFYEGQRHPWFKQCVEYSSCLCVHVLRKTLDFEVEGQRKKGSLREYGRSRLMKKV